MFSHNEWEEQINVRIDDKLSRIARGRQDVIQEDTELDLIGYLILKRVGRVVLGDKVKGRNDG
jgi:hypothetical protein